MFLEKIAVFLFAIWIAIIIALHIGVGYGNLQNPFYVLIICDFSLILILIFWRITNAVRFQQLKDLQRKYQKIELALTDRTQESHILSFTRRLIEKSSEGRAEGRGLKEILEDIAKEIEKFFPGDVVFMEVYSEEINFSFHFHSKPELEIPEILREEVIDKAQAKLINNLSSFPKYKDLAKNFSSLLAAPFVEKGKGIGILGVLTHELYEFTSRELELLSSITLHAGLIIENTELLEKTKYLSITDGLTQVFNRRHFQEKLQAEIQKAKEKHQPLSLIIGDIDNFKYYNDSQGHLAGDEVLKTIANILKKNTKGQDIVARFGGEEFVLILPRTDKKNAMKLAEDLREKVAEHVFPAEESMPQKDVTITFGVATYPEDGDTPEKILSIADQRLYKGKEQGKNQVVA
ncbi:MAG: sensor domain-containing diguanylate cyclase [Caldiserica bacterium]|nr:sensor domain-containing diguanylate cyclase [Caldisericota bacterium]